MTKLLKDFYHISIKIRLRGSLGKSAYTFYVKADEFKSNKNANIADNKSRFLHNINSYLKMNLIYKYYFYQTGVTYKAALNVNSGALIFFRSTFYS